MPVSPGSVSAHAVPAHTCAPRGQTPSVSPLLFPQGISPVSIGFDGEKILLKLTWLRRRQFREDCRFFFPSLRIKRTHTRGRGTVEIWAEMFFALHVNQITHIYSPK